MRWSRLAAIAACSLLGLLALVPVAAAAPETVPAALARLSRLHAITQAQERQDDQAYATALRDERRLSGTRRAELTAVTVELHDLAVAGDFTAARLPEIFLTLQRNVEQWTTGVLLAPDARVTFPGSDLIWEYYPGQGLQLQVLATFGAADGDYIAGRSGYPALEATVAQMLPLAVPAAGGITWDYLFDFDGGRPPWASAMADGTALEALTRAYKATRQPSYLAAGARILPALADTGPGGLSRRTSLGRRFLQYSFAPGTDIINAFLQTLIGLYDYARASRNALAESLFAQGNAEAEAEVPSFNTGAWSLYQPGIEDDLSYHELVTGFLQQLCARTAASVYCTTAADFAKDLKTPPVITQLTGSATAKRAFALRFRLSKVSHVGVVVLRGATTVFATSAQYPYGADAVAVPPLARGSYIVHLTATDLAGNFSRTVGSLRVGAAAEPAPKDRGRDHDDNR